MKSVLMRCAVSAMSVVVAAGAASAGLIDTRNENNLSISKSSDGVLGAGEYGPGNNQVYAGQGGGFGGTVGQGQTYMAADTNNWYVGFTPGNALNDNYIIQFSVNGAGIVNQATHGDNGDGGRIASTLAGGQLSAGLFPISVGYTLVIGNFGTVLFRYNTTTPNGALDFVQYDGNPWNTNGTAGGFHEVAIPWANIGLGAPASQIDWFGYYCSGSGYLSNEGVPHAPQYAGPTDGGGNIGFGNAGFPVNFADYDRFTTPAPSAVALLGLGGLIAGRRRRN